jgi:xanthine dehydrogenase accessory factor
MNELEGILRAYETLSQSGRVAALASIVGARGSAYRRIGAHMLVADDGNLLGGISGGCLERDVGRHAMWVMQSGKPARLVYDSTGDDDDDAEDNFGVGCNGVVEVLIERLLPGDAYMAFLARCMAGTQPGVVATVLESATDAATTGSRLLWRPGTPPLNHDIDDPNWAAALAQAASDVLVSGRSAAWTLQSASGRATVCFEIVGPACQLAIFGAGRDAAPLAALASALGMKVTVVDPRPGHATRLRFPTAHRLIVADPGVAVDSLKLEGISLAVVMGHNYRQDLAALRALLPTPLRYLGVLGPKARTERLLADLEADGGAVTRWQLSRLYSPVGLDIGAETPDEVALAIVAELKAVLANRRGSFSRERQGALHERPEPASPARTNDAESEMPLLRVPA